MFESYEVSSVSISKQFGATTSIGQLTRNVILSVAQFEREVTVERLRDKVTASKRKGLRVRSSVLLDHEMLPALGQRAVEFSGIRAGFECRP